ncbi:hypothetical protein MTR_3g073920 [Medicago truncatula]|uniref:Transmembrane protein n=1 Tax=Medicago truncatula TaxID=3880 RepID=G8A399_MEDTR|nr:hypothetical protein MTR_3g073920 [Medicago truncatula]
MFDYIANLKLFFLLLFAYDPLLCGQHIYDEDSSAPLIVEGIFNAASAGIYIY